MATDSDIRNAQVALGTLLREGERHESATDGGYSFEFCCPLHVIVALNGAKGMCVTRLDTDLVARADSESITQVFVELRRKLIEESKKVEVAPDSSLN